MSDEIRQRKKLPAHEAIIVLLDEEFTEDNMRILLKLLKRMNIPSGEKEWVVSELRRIMVGPQKKVFGDWTPNYEETVRTIQEE